MKIFQLYNVLKESTGGIKDKGYTHVELSRSVLKDEQSLKSEIDNQKTGVADDLERSKKYAGGVVKISEILQSRPAKGKGRSRAVDVDTPKKQIEDNLSDIKSSSQEVLNITKNSELVQIMINCGIIDTSSVKNQNLRDNLGTYLQKLRDGTITPKEMDVVLKVQKELNVGDGSIYDKLASKDSYVYLITRLNELPAAQKLSPKNFLQNQGETFENIVSNASKPLRMYIAQMGNDIQALWRVGNRSTGPGEFVLSLLLNKGYMCHGGNGDVQFTDDKGKSKYIEVKYGEAAMIAHVDLSVKTRRDAVNRINNLVYHVFETGKRFLKEDGGLRYAALSLGRAQLILSGTGYKASVTKWTPSADYDKNIVTGGWDDAVKDWDYLCYFAPPSSNETVLKSPVYFYEAKNIKTEDCQDIQSGVTFLTQLPVNNRLLKKGGTDVSGTSYILRASANTQDGNDSLLGLYDVTKGMGNSRKKNLNGIAFTPHLAVSGRGYAQYETGVLVSPLGAKTDDGITVDERVFLSLDEVQSRFKKNFNELKAVLNGKSQDENTINELKTFLGDIFDKALS